MALPALARTLARLRERARGDDGAHRLAGLALLGVLTLVLPFPGLLSGGVLYLRDVHLVWHPQIEALVRTVAAGAWPLWDPGLAFGQPELADPAWQVLYPPTWLGLFLPPWVHYSVLACGHVLFSAFGALRLARAWGLSATAAFTTAATWACSGPFLASTDLWHHFAGAAWMPWVLLAVDRAAARPGAKSALAGGAALGAQVLAGSADACALTWPTALLLALVRHPGAAARRPRLGALALAVAVGSMLAAGVVLPALDVVSRSERSSLPDSVRTQWSLPPVALAELVVPGLWSPQPLEASLARLMFDGREAFLGSLHLGGVAGVLALLGLFAESRGRRSVALLLAFTLLFAMGKHFPVYGALAGLFPPVRIFRYPVKALWLAALLWSLLAGLGIDRYRSGAEPGVRRAAAAISVLLGLGLLGLALAVRIAGPGAYSAYLADVPRLDSHLEGWSRVLMGSGLACAGAGAVLALRPTPGLGLVLASLAALQLGWAHQRALPLAPGELYRLRPPALDALRGAARVYAYDYSYPRSPQGDWLRLREMPPGWGPTPSLALAQQLALTPSTPERWGLRGSFDVDYRGLYPRGLVVLDGLLRGVEGREEHTRLLRLGGVSHVVARHSIPGLELAGEFEGLFAAPTRVFRVPDPLPGAYLVSEALPAPGDDVATAGILISPEFVPERQALIAGLPRASVSPGPPGSVKVVSERADRIEIDVAGAAPGWLVVIGSFDPGWRATLDGQAVPVHRANLAFRAVQVPPGHHRVTMTYRPAAVLIGAGLSAGTALVLLVLACAGLARRSRG